MLENFRSIDFCDVELGPLTFLVGPNGSGKSNFLESLNFISQILSSRGRSLNEIYRYEDLVRVGSDRPQKLRIRLDFQFNSTAYGHYALELTKLEDDLIISREECRYFKDSKLYEFNRHTELVTWTSEKQIPNANRSRPFLIKAANAIPKLFEVRNALTRMAIYQASPFAKNNMFLAYLWSQKHAILHPDGSNQRDTLIGLFRVKSDVLKHIELYLKIIFPSFDGFEFRHVPASGKGRYKKAYTNVSFRQINGEPPQIINFSLDNISSGTNRALNILIALFQSRAGGPFELNLIGIEEPEMALHPAAAGVLRDCLRDASQTIQVIVTSHSPELLDDKEIQSDCIIAVVAENGITRIGQVDHITREVLKDHLMTAGELLRLNQLVPATEPAKDSNARFFELSNAI